MRATEQHAHDLRGLAATVEALSMLARADELPTDADEALRIAAEKIREIAERMEVDA